MTKPTLKRRPVAEEPSGNDYFTKPKESLQLIHSGCALLDCVLGGGWPLGRIVNVVGDKSTGKTLLAIEAMANFRRTYEGIIAYAETEAAFDDEYAHALGLNMDGVARPECTTVEELFEDLSGFIKLCEGKAGLYIVDSLDALSDKAEMERTMEEGTYGATKAKQLGQLFRRLVKPLEASNVCVMVISQVRDNIGVSFGEKHTRSGGKALDFYASQILWLANKGQNKITRSKVMRTIGVSIKAKIKKNKIGMPFRECDFDILFGYGIDDVTSGLQFLSDAGALERLDIASTPTAVRGWKSTFDEASQEDQIEMREVLANAVRGAWYEIEAAFAPKKGKYA